mmetsp:Transcript_17669/g.31415  ORF Transcript_17669/g.31415 Transcript_17669/m.31415 type:complete len:84 (+) Transcript_17669:4113-4364(+)
MRRLRTAADRSRDWKRVARGTSQHAASYVRSTARCLGGDVSWRTESKNKKQRKLQLKRPAKLDLEKFSDKRCVLRRQVWLLSR